MRPTKTPQQRRAILRMLTVRVPNNDNGRDIDPGRLRRRDDVDGRRPRRAEHDVRGAAGGHRLARIPPEDPMIFRDTQTPTRGDAQGWVDQPPPVADGAGRLPQPVSGSLSPRPPRRRGRRTTAGRPRPLNPAVAWMLLAGAVSWALILAWIGVL